MARNPANDITFYVDKADLDFNPLLDGELISLVFTDTTFDFNFTLNGQWVIGLIFPGYIGEVNLSIDSDFFIEYLKSNWVKWSKVGEFDFTLDKSNMAGEMPMDWKGEILRIGQLGKNIIVYGTGGISSLIPADNVFGKRGLLRRGIMSKGAVLITEAFHLFITHDGCLWKLDDKLIKLGYEEYLSTMSSPVISYDEINDLAYICDGTLGFVFNCGEPSLGQGPVNVTGVGYHEGNSYFITSDTLETPGFEISFDTLDFLNRGFKTIREVQLGMDSTGTFQLGLSFKNGITPTYNGPVWFNVTPEGRVFPNCWGKDFKLHLKSNNPGQIKLSYIKINGQFADYNPLDG